MLHNVSEFGGLLGPTHATHMDMKFGAWNVRSYCSLGWKGQQEN